LVGEGGFVNVNVNLILARVGTSTSTSFWFGWSWNMNAQSSRVTTTLCGMKTSAATLCAATPLRCRSRVSMEVWN